GSGLEDGTGMPAAADGCVHDHTRGHRLEELDHLPAHHRLVLEATHRAHLAPMLRARRPGPLRAWCQPPGRTSAVRLSLRIDSVEAGGVGASPRRPGG